MLQTASHKTGGGACSPEGRACQIAARISNGVHFQSPVLPNGIESQAAWETHLASLEESLQPVGAWEKLCVYRIALSAWKHFRLVRHEVALVAAAIGTPDNQFKSSYDEDYVHAEDVAEVLRRSESSIAEELFQMRDFMLRVRVLATDNGEGVAFTALECRQILSSIIEQSQSDCDDDDAENDANGDDDGEPANAVQQDPAGRDGEDIDDVALNNEQAIVIPAAQLREEIEQIAGAGGVNIKEAIGELANTLSVGIRSRQRRLEAARTHIGACLIPDERNVNRLAIYERGPARLWTRKAKTTLTQSSRPKMMLLCGISASCIPSDD